jgi:uncharacterized protein YgbK (DUF1537 family)
MLVGAVADDDTGMTDLCGMFTQHGVNAVMFFEKQPQPILEKYSKTAEVVAIGTRARTIDPHEAYKKTRDALEALRSLEPRMYYLKYCSTFDSTPKGNIGQMIDAGLDILGGYTIAVPALPVNGRTTYMGNHFVNGVRLDRSPMRTHPLTPMTESDLVLWLSYQTKRKVGLADYNTVRKGPKALKRKFKMLREDGYEVIVVDAIAQRDIRTIDEAVWDLKLVTGSSGLAMELPPIWRRKGLFNRTAQDLSNVEVKSGVEPVLVIAGSVSTATRSQNRYCIEMGFHGIKLDTVKLVSSGHGAGFEDEVDRVADDAIKNLLEGRNVIVYSAIDEADVSKTKTIGHGKGLSDIQVGEIISEANGEISKRVLDRVNLNKLIVAGGETANSVGRKLGLVGLYVGQQIHPGVPTCFTISDIPLYSGIVVALKSGNFGKINFYEDALLHMRRYLKELGKARTKV